MNDQRRPNSNSGQPPVNKESAPISRSSGEGAGANPAGANSSGKPRRRRRRRGRTNAHTNSQRTTVQSDNQGQPQGTPAKSQEGPGNSEPKTEPAHNQGIPPRKRRRTRRSGPAKPATDNTQTTVAETNEEPAGRKPGRRQAGKASQATQGQSRTNRPGKPQNQGRGSGRGGTQKVPRTAAYRPNQESSLRTSDEISAGGLVISGLAEAVNPDKTVDLNRIYVALIGRLDRRGRLLWSMPKGHVEPGEDRAATAEREVWEETGICGKVLTELGVIDYWFVSDGVRIHKTVHHHLLAYVDGDLNDEDPEVTEVSWIPASQLLERLAYADERKLARIAHDLLPEFALNASAEGRLTPR